MGDQHHGAVVGQHPVDGLVALALEGLVAHREHLVDQHDRVLQLGDEREAQAHLHAAGVVPDRGVDELRLDLREVDDLVEALVDRLLGHAVQGAHQVHVLPAGQVVVEPGAQLQERRDLAVHADLALVRDEHPGDHLEQRRLARAVLTDDAHAVALGDVEGHIAQRPELVALGVGVTLVAVDEHLTETALASAVHGEFHTEALGLDDRTAGDRGLIGGRHHNSFSTDVSRRRNVQYPMTSIRIEPTTAEVNARGLGVSSSNPANQIARCIWKIPISGLSS